MAKEMQMYRTVFWTLWEKARVGWFERIALKHKYITICEIEDQSKFDAWNKALKAGTLGQPRGMGWGVRWEGGSGWRRHVHPWLIHVNVWQKSPQYCKVISLQLKLINFKKEYWSGLPFPFSGNLPNPGIKPRSPALQVDSLSIELLRQKVGHCKVEI